MAAAGLEIGLESSGFLFGLERDIGFKLPRPIGGGMRYATFVVLG